MGTVAKKSLKKQLSEYRVVVFDLDGTLYYQRRLRIKMAWMLGTYYLCHPGKIKELLIVKKFREVREDWDEICVREAIDVVGDKDITSEHSIGDDTCNGDNRSPLQNSRMNSEPDGDSPLDIAQYTYVASKMKCSYEQVRDTIRMWMYVKPLKAVYETRDVRLLDEIARMKYRGQQVVILSDYPVEDKLKALGIIDLVEGMYSATDEKLGELKPSPKGLNMIMQDYGVNKDQLVMIGDRYIKDGKAAENAGCDFVILGKKARDRDISEL